jgi:teichoic acid transport system ATP-binding protein
VEVNGKVVSLIDLGAGFHPELSGRENILLNGLLVGMDYEEICGKMDKIISFADIGSYINEPLFSYSDGMKLRLGFAIAINACPEILLLDEGISVGDAGFQIKCREKVWEFLGQGKTIIIVTHWLPILEEYCERIIWIEKGKVIMDGKRDEVLKKYTSYHETKNG